MSLKANTRRRIGRALSLSVFIGNGGLPQLRNFCLVGNDALQFDSSVIEVFGSGSSAIQQSGFATDDRS